MSSAGDYSDIDEGPDFREEIGAANRAGPAGYNLGDRILMNPLDRFRTNVDGIARNLSNWDKVISESGILEMIEKADQLEDVGHKNATAYVVAYIATNGGGILTKPGFDKAINLLSHVEDGSVLPPDVIRYARLWGNMK